MCAVSWSDRTRVYAGLLQAIVYADVFDYPLTLTEVQRYAVATPVSLSDVMAALAPGSPLRRVVEVRGGWVTLAGRGHLVERRRRRQRWARRLWRKAAGYVQRIAQVPFVRMVAITGALAVDNVAPDDDVDFFIVTEPGRLWLCRALVILLVRWAARRGDTLCPNYFLSTRALALRERDLFTAHEVAQMVPAYGLEVYRRFRQANRWTLQLLPNAPGPPRVLANGAQPPWWRPWTEGTLRTPLGAALEAWERGRKIRRFTKQSGPHVEVFFSPDHCKGHFDGHGRRTLQAFAARWETVRRVLDLPAGRLICDQISL